MKEKEHILVIDDEFFIRVAYQMILTDAGYTSTIASDGEEAFEKILECQNNNTKIDLILTDINMPKINGFDFVNKFNEFNFDIPVLMMSSYREDEIEVLVGSKLFESAILSSCDYIEKPSDSQNLIDSIKRKINREYESITN